jgi:2-alkenal reductase
MNALINRKMIYPLLVVLLLPVLALACGVFTPTSVPFAPVPPVQVVVTPPTPPEKAVSVVTTVEDSALVDLYSRVNPAVVNITVFETQNGVLTPLAQGSGFVYDSDGHIITNAHVVHGSTQFEVTFSNGVTRTATVAGEDLNSDLAVLNAQDMPAGIEPLVLGNIESLAVGQSVVAIGNPFGLEGTLTRGIISALGRSIPALTPFTIPQAIQTDAAINPGNSGGPLLDLNGEVIGVNAQIETGGTSNSNLGIGFAIPVSIVQLVVPDLIQNGSHDWAWLGVRGGNLSPALIKGMELTVDQGAYIAEVISGGPSAKAGLHGATRQAVVDEHQVEIGGDVITAIDGQPVTTFDDLLIYVSLHTKPGQQVTLTILRDGKSQQLQVTLEKRPDTLDNSTSPS